MSTIELLPCPFCGASASIERIGNHRQSTIYSCDSCSCSLETGEEWGHGRMWNNQAARAQARNAALEEAAKVADNAPWQTSGDRRRADAIAAAISALKDGEG